MDLSQVLSELKKRDEFEKVGMILSHNGVVRGFSRNGKKVTKVKVSFNGEKIRKIREEMLVREGIFEILIEVCEGTLSVGSDIMYVVVAGDIRDNVFSVLRETVERIKKEIIKEEEILID